MKNIEEQIPKITFCTMCQIENGRPQFSNIKNFNVVKAYDRFTYELRIVERYVTVFLCDRHYEEIIK